SGTVLDNLLVGRPAATQQEDNHPARKALTNTFIEALPQGYATRIGDGGGWQSGGERQRRSIARARRKNSPNLLLDE
ncbi:ABC transporter ATP-binding protein, partial [Pseudomonas syringae pv. tagetis]